MAEYIEREKLRQKMYQEAFVKDSNLQRWDSGCWIRYKLFENVLEKTEVADVQPVVRCKDCKHFHLDYFGEVNGASIIVAHEICDLWAGGCRTTQDTFCSNGVRKDDGT